MTSKNTTRRALVCALVAALVLLVSADNVVHAWPAEECYGALANYGC